MVLMAGFVFFVFNDFGAIRMSKVPKLPLKFHEGRGSACGRLEHELTQTVLKPGLNQHTENVIKGNRL